MIKIPFLKIAAATMVFGIVHAVILHKDDEISLRPWSPAKSMAWYHKQPWLVGVNYITRTAVNPLEMWRAETFDLVTIDQELGWAEDIGFNSIRVFLHDLLWEEDSQGLLKRMDQFLAIADRHHIKVMFVLLDGAWNPYPHPGPQLQPRPHVHNSRWVQSPGIEVLLDPTQQERLKYYITGVIARFRDDRRVIIWDLYNEADIINQGSFPNIDPQNKPELATALLKKTFTWARSVNPSQPLTTGVWVGDWASYGVLYPINRVMLGQSDIITFHSYFRPQAVRRDVQYLKRYRRPILCTEYMARPLGSTFDPILADFKERDVGAYSWGFVSGKSQTIYPWDSWQKIYTSEPKVWFHDILRPDGTPFSAKEVDYIKRLTGAKKWVPLGSGDPFYSWGYN